MTASAPPKLGCVSRMLFPAEIAWSLGFDAPIELYWFPLPGWLQVMADLPLSEHLLVYAVCVATVAEPKSVTYTYAGPPQLPHAGKGPISAGGAVYTHTSADTPVQAWHLPR